jgi:acyl-CoA synthetase (AMP-forming)/AMP-acid ligase II
VNLGRAMIVSGGESISPVEVAGVIERHPLVESCVVIGIPDPQWGERVHARVVLVRGASLEAEELRDFVGDHIARHKAPRSLELLEPGESPGRGPWSGLPA